MYLQKIRSLKNLIRVNTFLLTSKESISDSTYNTLLCSSAMKYFVSTLIEASFVEATRR